METKTEHTETDQLATEFLALIQPMTYQERHALLEKMKAMTDEYDVQPE